jgi:hypothetical protein
MAKMSGKTNDMVDDLRGDFRKQDKKLEVIMEILQELRPHKQDHDPTQKHPRSDFPSPQLQSLTSSHMHQKPPLTFPNPYHHHLTNDLIKQNTSKFLIF